VAIMKTAIPPDAALAFGCTVEFVALDPTSGAAITGVVVSNAELYVSGEDLAGLNEGTPFMLVVGPNA
jgi:hypothetical protein